MVCKILNRKELVLNLNGKQRPQLLKHFNCPNKMLATHFKGSEWVVLKNRSLVLHLFPDVLNRFKSMPSF